MVNILTSHKVWPSSGSMFMMWNFRIICPSYIVLSYLFLFRLRGVLYERWKKNIIIQFKVQLKLLFYIFPEGTSFVKWCITHMTWHMTQAHTTHRKTFRAINTFKIRVERHWGRGCCSQISFKSLVHKSRQSIRADKLEIFACNDSSLGSL